MRKSISLLLVAVLLLSILVLSGCSTDKVKVESVLEIDGGFSGHRSITLKFPLDTHIDELSKTLVSNNPLKDYDKSSFEYEGVAQDGYIFVMDIVFDSHDEYVEQVETIVGRQVSSTVSQPDSILVSGTRMLEDFDVSELVAWARELTAQNEDTKKLQFDYPVNTVSVNGSLFNTGSTIDISEREGMPINSITIETTNLKDDTYDRTITFSIPNKTYVDLAGSLEEYFTANTSPAAQYCDFTSQGTSWEYKVIYKGITLEELSTYTAMLLDTSNDGAFYGDKNNSSTPLSEGLMFEENFDTFSYMNSDGESVQLVYKYALPTKTTHGDGTIFCDGKWETAGSWQDGIYTVETESDVMNIRIPDGIQYAINGINMDLEVVSEDSFVRTTEFLYSKTQGMDGMLYAKSFFESKGATVVTDEDDDNLICRVICQGSSSQITDQLVKLFGSGNFMAYSIRRPAFALSAKTELTDYINLGYMLTSTNANRPITYSVHSSCDENIITLSCDESNSKSKDDNSHIFTVDVDGGQGTIVYNGNIPIVGNIILFCLIAFAMFLSTVGAIIYMVHKQRKKHSASAADDIPDSAPQQTTTFSIAELTALSEKTAVDKELRDEIDKDIERKIEADRIGDMSKALKAKEIEALEKMIYGTPDEEQVADETSDAQPQDDTEQKD